MNNCLCRISVLWGLTFGLPLFSYAATSFSGSFTLNGIEWSVSGTDVEGGTIFVSDKTQPLPAAVDIPDATAFPDSVTTGGLIIPATQYFITSIGNRAFYGTTGMVTVRIPKTITEISQLAFSESSLSSIVIPDNVSRIGSGVFEGCDYLQTVQLSNAQGENFDGREMFKNCTMLQKVEIPFGWSFIPSWMCEGCTSMSSVSFPMSLTKIGDSAFKNCTALREVKLPKFLVTIGATPFLGCTGLREINVPVGLTTTKTMVSLCGSSVAAGLTEIHVDAGATELAGELFKNCTALTTVVLPEGLETIGRQCFGSSYSSSSCVNLAQINLPSSLISIGYDAFRCCSALQAIELPDSVTECGNNTFQDCKNLTSVKLSSSLKQIPNSMFRYCTALTSVSIPEGVTEIGAYAFNGCTSLATITFNGAPLTTVGSSAFPETIGYYTEAYSNDWETVLDANGKWKNLTMLPLPGLTLPEGLSDTTSAWLKAALKDAGFAKGTVTFKEGTTTKHLEEAQLLGVIPKITQGVSETIEVAVGTDFNVNNILLSDENVSITMGIEVTEGSFPNEVAFAGTIVLKVANALDGTWTECLPSENQIGLTRISDTKVALTITEPIGQYRFLQVIVR